MNVTSVAAMETSGLNRDGFRWKIFVVTAIMKSLSIQGEDLRDQPQIKTEHAGAVTILSDESRVQAQFMAITNMSGSTITQNDAV
jgi:hypothetical protein